jgi:thymidylate synthase ThyX
MRKIEAQTSIKISHDIYQGVLPLYETEVAKALTEQKRQFLDLLMTNPEGEVHVFRDNMPGVLAGMLTARSSRAIETDIGEVLWEEFVVSPELGLKHIVEHLQENEGLSEALSTEKAEKMTSRILDRFGDDSVREDASAYVAVRKHSVLTSMELFHHPLVTGIEASTRYIDWRNQEDGHYRYVRPEVIMNSEHAGLYVETMDNLFETYSELWPKVWDHIVEKIPQKEEESDAAYAEAVRGKVCDVLRKLLPLGIETNLVIHAHYRTLSETIMNLRASESSESRKLADEMAEELKKVNPRFIAVVDNVHGGEWVAHQEKQREIDQNWCVAKTESWRPKTGVEVRVLNADYRHDLIRAIYQKANPGLTKRELDFWVRRFNQHQLKDQVTSLEEIRENRRHKVDSIFESVVLEVDYEGISFSSYKDFNRHRNIITKTEPDWSADRGFFVPPLIEEIGGEVFEKYCHAQERAIAAKRILEKDFEVESRLLLTHGTKTKFTITMSLGESIWIEELRTISSGDPEYRWFAQQQCLKRRAAMPELAAVGQFVDFNDYQLGRIKEAVKADLKGKKGQQ